MVSFVPLEGGSATPPAASRWGNLLLPLSADVRTLDDAIAYSKVL